MITRRRLLAGASAAGLATFLPRLGRTEAGDDGGVISFTEDFSAWEMQTNRSYTIPSFQITRPSGTVMLGRISPLATDTGWNVVSGEAATLDPNGVALSARYVKDAVVHQGGSALTEGVHYRIEYNTGSLYGLSGSGAVTVDYSWAASRYDTLWWDPVTSGLGGAGGTQHAWNPDAFIPPVPAGMIPLVNVYFWKTPGVDHIQLIPTCNYWGSVAHGREGKRAAWIAKSRQQLPKMFKALRAGAPVTVVGLGTSITHQGGDSLGYFGHYKSDALATIPFSGKVGWCWAVKRQIEATRGSAVTVVNLGVDGNTSNAALASDRLAALAAAIATGLSGGGAVTVFLEFGQNEWGSVSIAANIATLIAFIRSCGGEAIVMGIPPVSEYVQLNWPGYSSHESREATSEAAARAALYAGVPFVSTADLFGRGNEGATGLSRRTQGSANAFNHPGHVELGLMAQSAVSLFA